MKICILVFIISLHFVFIFLSVYLTVFEFYFLYKQLCENSIFLCLIVSFYKYLQGDSVHLHHTRDSFSSDLRKLFFLVQTFWLKDNSVYSVDSDRKKKKTNYFLSFKSTTLLEHGIKCINILHLGCFKTSWMRAGFMAMSGKNGIKIFFSLL